MTPDENALLREFRAYHRGTDQAISAPALGARFKRAECQIRADIRSLRLQGIPIAGTPSEGFFYPSNHRQAEHTSKNLWSQVYALKEVAEAYDLGVEKEFGAPTLFEEVRNG